MKKLLLTFGMALKENSDLASNMESITTLIENMESNGIVFDDVKIELTEVKTEIKKGDTNEKDNEGKTS
jgi:hypothetical protein